MRLALAVLWCGLGAASSASANEVPFPAFTNADHVPVLAGPADSYFMTDRLPEGAEVEVYRYDPGGWCAVRPPEDSFSWVQAKHLKMTPQGDVARVVGRGAVTHVGTRFGDDHQVPYVHLRDGELVQVLGSRRMADAAGRTDVWIKIAPPAGEFRWIHQRFLTRSKPEVRTVAATDDDLKTDGVAPIPAHDPSADESDAQAVRSVFKQDEAETPTQEEPDKPEGWNETVSADQINALLATLDTELSLMVSQPTATWKLGALRDRAELVTNAAGATAGQRDVAAALLERIERFAEIELEEGRLQAEQVVEQLADATESPDATVGSGLDPDRPKRNLDAHFEGTGWLMPVQVRKRGVPAYALTDDFGRVLHFVTPGPGLNLNRYVKKQVGVYGRAGYLPQLRKPHLTADRIVPLTTTR